MIPFPQGAIDFARQLNQANLPDTCTVHLAGAWVPDGEGGGDWAPGGTVQFPCRTWPLNAKEMETLVAEQLREPGLEGLVMPVGQALPANATVTVTRSSGAVFQYEVKGRIPDPTYAMLSRAIIKRIYPPPESVPEEET